MFWRHHNIAYGFKPSTALVSSALEASKHIVVTNLFMHLCTSIFLHQLAWGWLESCSNSRFKSICCSDYIARCMVIWVAQPVSSMPSMPRLISNLMCNRIGNLTHSYIFKHARQMNQLFPSQIRVDKRRSIGPAQADSPRFRI